MHFLQQIWHLSRYVSIPSQQTNSRQAGLQLPQIPNILNFFWRAASFVLPSFTIQSYREELKSKKLRSTAYLDGMRGCAAFVVFVYHYGNGYLPLDNGFGQGENQWPIQLPIIRLGFAGSPMVAIFFAISGFALSLKPLKLFQEEQYSEASATLSSYVFRRGIGLFLPPIVSSFMFMIGIRMHSLPPQHSGLLPEYLPTFWNQVYDFIRSCFTELVNPFVSTFTPQFRYGPHLWTLPKEFQSSMVIFLTLMGLSSKVAIFRLMVSFLLFPCCLLWGEWEVGLFFGGLFLAELSLLQHQYMRESIAAKSVAAKSAHTIFWGSCLISSLYLASFPDNDGHRTPGFIWLSSKVPQFRYHLAVGAVGILLSINNIPCLKTIFTALPLQYLGQISFSLYIVHSPFVIVFRDTIILTMWHVTGNGTRTQFALGLSLGFIVLAPLVLWIADIFWRLVDVPSVKLAKWIE
ncbi:acyltransferase 3, partial [Xylogone sp. PMI_703]